MARLSPPHQAAGDLVGPIQPQPLCHPPHFLNRGPPPFPALLDPLSTPHPIIALTRTLLRAYTAHPTLIHPLANSPIHVSIPRCNVADIHPLDPPRPSSASIPFDRAIPLTRAPWSHNGNLLPSPWPSISPPSLSTITSPIHAPPADCLVTRLSSLPYSPSRHPVTSALLPMHYLPYPPSRICAVYPPRIPPQFSND